MWEVINNILAVIGLISLVQAVIRTIWVFTQNSEWIDNISIEEYQLDVDLEEDTDYVLDFYPDVPERVDNEYATQNLFIPQSTIIKKVVLKKVRLIEKENNTLEKYERVHVFHDVSPHNPICLVIERRHSIPEYMLEWKTDYGVTAQYYFGENCRNGINSFSGFRYHVGFWAKIRKVLDLK